jgi:hypothetical protein
VMETGLAQKSSLQSLTKLIPVSDPIQTGVLYNGGRVIRSLWDHAWLVG